MASRITAAQQIEEHDSDLHAHPKLLELIGATQTLASATHGDVKRITGWLEAAGMDNGSAEALKRIIQREDLSMELEEARVVMQRAKRERRQQLLTRLRYAQWKAIATRAVFVAGALSTVGWAVSAWTGHSPAQLIGVFTHH